MNDKFHFLTGFYDAIILRNSENYKKNRKLRHVRVNESLTMLRDHWISDLQWVP